MAEDLGAAVEAAATLAEAGEAFGDPLGSGAVLVTGSVVTVGEARSLLVRPERASRLERHERIEQDEQDEE